MSKKRPGAGQANTNTNTNTSTNTHARVDPVRALVACSPRHDDNSLHAAPGMPCALGLHSTVRIVRVVFPGGGDDDAEGRVELVRTIDVRDEGNAGVETGPEATRPLVGQPGSAKEGQGELPDDTKDGTEGNNGSSKKKRKKRNNNADVNSGNVNVIRALQFSPDGAFLAVAGDDKALYVYDVEHDFELVRRYVSPKKLSCVTWVGNTGVLVANKYGDVVVVDVREGGKERELLGHFCSIVLSLSVSGTMASDDTLRLLSSTDRDAKVRVTSVDVRRLHEVDQNNEIQSFCLGHTAYVSGGVFVKTDGLVGADGRPEFLLVTGGGDGVRVWNPMDGTSWCENVLMTSKVLQMVGVGSTGVLVIFDGGGEPTAALLSFAGDGGVLPRVTTHVIPGLKKISGVDVDRGTSTACFVGANAAGGLAVQCMAVDEAAMELKPVPCRVADAVLESKDPWVVSEKFFADYYATADAGVIDG